MLKEIMKKLEVFFIANKSENIYFTLLGDCSSSKKEKEDFDDEIIKSGIEECNKLNAKYPDANFPKFNFVYRKRLWNKSENCYLGWERKRGLLTQFNEYMLGKRPNCFSENTLEMVKDSGKQLPKIKYIITLDSDTNLVLNTGLELVGAMAHILNKPILNEEKTLVIDGFGIMQPRIGIGLLETRKSIFTKIFSGLGGTDSYTNAISDFYYDNFGEGIFTGKGIYDLKIFSEVLDGEIPENTVLSHDLLEGCYARCGLASDVVLMDGYPTTYNAYKTRLHRWIRGDYQIILWLMKKRLNILSKYKILDNINRSLSEVCVVILLFLNLIIKSKWITTIAIISVIIPYILDAINKVLYKKNGHVVGYMGDGVNDAPSLNKSDVGISVNSASSIAKEASDIIILKQSLKVVYDGVIEGRKVYGNIIKYMKMALSADFGDVFSIMISSIFLPFLPLLPIQMLLQDFIYDFSQIGIPYDNVDKEFLIKPKKWDTKGISRFMKVMGITSSIIDVISFIIFWFVLGYNSIDKQAYFQTAWFITCLVTELMIIYNVRTSKKPFIESNASHKLNVLTIFSLVLTIITPILLTKIDTFHFVILPFEFYLFLILLVILYFIIVSIIKKIYIKKYGEWL